jgi:hypothetical protein
MKKNHCLFYTGILSELQKCVFMIRGFFSFLELFPKKEKKNKRKGKKKLELIKTLLFGH